MNDNREWTANLIPLHRIRQLVAEDDAERRAIKDAFEAEHAARWENMALRREAAARIEDDVKAEALRLYKTIPGMQKKDLPGATIQDKKVFGWSPDAAIAWCIDHKAAAALKLNETAYKKQIEFGGAPGTLHQETVVVLTTDLGPIVNPAKVEVQP